MLKLVLRFLTWARIVDAHDGVVSLTCVALWVTIVKLALVREASVPDLAALMAALLAYAHKRMVKPKAEAVVPAAAAAVPDPAVGALTAKVKDLEAFMASVKLGSRR